MAEGGRQTNKQIVLGPDYQTNATKQTNCQDLPRTRERCDQLASKGFKVIMPDYYHGEEAKICSGADFFCWMSQFFSGKSPSSS